MGRKKDGCIMKDFYKQAETVVKFLMYIVVLIAVILSSHAESIIMVLCEKGIAGPSDGAH